jgi:hypothetical protein
MSEPLQDFIAECQLCGRPFVMGEAGNTGTQIGTTGKTYVESLVIHGDQITMKGVQGRCPHSALKLAPHRRASDRPGSLMGSRRGSRRSQRGGQ